MQTDTVRNQLLLRLITVISLLWAVSISSGIYAQETEWEISGIVTNRSGEKLMVVTVSVKGTTRSVVADVNGKYTIMVPENSILVFSRQGYDTQEIHVGHRSVIDVAMEEDETTKGLPSVVVVKAGGQGIKSAERIDLSWKQGDKASADNGFGFRMFREVSKLQGTNTFFSPLSLNMAIGMLYNGASDVIRKEMDEVSGITNFSVSELNDYYRTISEEFLQIDPTTEIAIANAIWYRNKLQVKEDFIEALDRYFDAEVAALDFSDPETASIINDWCRDKTRGRINNIAPDPFQGDMFLTNALYFKSKWEKSKKFDKEDTKPDDFTKGDKTKSRVNMMEQTTELPYYADEHLQCVELPYGNKAFSMIAILPQENGNIDQLIDYLKDGVEWDPIGSVVKEMKYQRVWLKMPRFRLECELSLNQPLQNAGMGSIFKGEFLHLADTVMGVGNILQKTFVEVNEEGTEAAAVTKLMLVGAVNLPSEPVTFFANRPFLFLIREKSTGVILFIGRVDDPQE